MRSPRPASLPPREEGLTGDITRVGGDPRVTHGESDVRPRCRLRKDMEGG